MNLIRPEIQAFITRWREPLVLGALGVIAILFLLFRLNAPIMVVVLGLVAIGLLSLSFVAARRVLLRDLGLGQGYVSVSEQKISYFSVEGGTALSIDDISAVHISADLRAGHHHEHYWMITGTGGAVLTIPANVSGIEDLMNSLSSLPGIDIGAAMRFAMSGKSGTLPVWTRPE